MRKILKESKEFDQAMYEKLLTRPNGKDGQRALPVLLYSDIQRLIQSMQSEFPEIIKLSSIGKTYQGRDITLVTLDAREHIVNHQFKEVALAIVNHKKNQMKVKNFNLL